MGWAARRVSVIAGMVGVALFSGPVFAQEADAAHRLADLALALDMTWMLVAAALVLLMQLGFMFLEAGIVRSKNSVNVAQKNVLDLIAAILIFAIVGFMFSFGTSAGPIGWDGRFFAMRDLTAWEYAFFAFQVMFCGTAATIVSGAVAERLRLNAYVVCTIVLAGVIYPAFVHWSWGDALIENSGAILANLGFVDFAGSTVVHATGAWVALAGCIVIGARAGRFDASGRPSRIVGHSAVLTTAGAIILFVGWLGFNGGSTTEASAEIGPIIANTVLAAGVGGFVGYLLGYRMDGAALPERSICGLLGGLVAVTAGAHVLDGSGALLIGALGGAAALWGNWLLEHRFKLDDAVGAIGVHGFAGVVGTLGLVFLARPGTLPHDNLFVQFGVQTFGVALNFVWAFGMGFVLFKVMSRFLSIRPSNEEEEVGLNETEHKTRLGVGHIETALGALVNDKASLDLRLPVTRGDDAEGLTHLFNRFMERIEKSEKDRGTRREIQRAREESERLATMADAAFEGICVTVDGRIRDCNRALEILLERSLSDMRTMSLFDIVEPKDVEIIEAALDRNDDHPFEISMRAASGGLVPVEVRTRKVLYRGEVRRIFAIVDLRERKVAEDRIRFLAQHDPLTGLPNRAVFGQKLEVAIESARKGDVINAVLLVDLDKFKDVNDVHGHPVGDEVIRQAAARLVELVGASGTVARLGGDEFAVILQYLHFANQASDVAHQIVEALSRQFEMADGLKVRVGASVGVALLPRDGLESDLIFARADLALYAAKSGGRNDWSIFEPGMDAELQKRRLLEADLSGATERGEFELYFQPRFDIERQEIGGYEALLRWNHPERGQVSPAEFIPLAEGSGQIVDIGEWVLREACRNALSYFPGKSVSVNVSPVQFRDRSFVDKVFAIVDDLEFPAQFLELELTESVLIEDADRALVIFRQLKRRGIRIALDDFGTGYSSLSYLRSFPFDCIKIDQSFVRNLNEDKNARAIAEAVISLGRSLDMRIVAEGVESHKELALLARSGCDEIQGYLTGRPSAVSALHTRVDVDIALDLPSRDVLPKDMAERVLGLHDDLGSQTKKAG